MNHLERVAADVARAEQRRTIAVSVAFVGPTRMRALNRRYRGVNHPTDVLSFESDEPGYLGDVLLCRSYIRQQARDVGVSHEEELVRMTIHGVLHLLGYSHIRSGDAKKMFRIQEYYLKKFV